MGIIGQKGLETMAGRDVRDISREEIREKARMIRLETLRLTDICGSGHYGSAFSMAEVLASLYYRFLHVNANEPQWVHRDRFTMGKGHAAIALYPVLADIGFFPEDWLDDYTRFGSPLGDHPDMGKVPGVDFSSGSIGHNLSVSVGMALGLRAKDSPARTVCMMGDGEQTEGQVWEAAISAAHWKLDTLVGIVDINQAGSDGNPQETMKTEPLAEKWEAFGWRVLVLEDGHDLDAVAGALDQALNKPDGRPTCVLAHTIAGKGVSFMEGGWEWHLGFLGPKDLERAYREVKEGTIG
jgi:transketolase